jgi:hypothetical protein
MRLTLVALGMTTVAAFALAALVATSSGESKRVDEPRMQTGPAVALYVVDHYGAQPDPASLAPYREAFGKVLAGCWIGRDALASVVLQLSEQASLGSGTNIDTLEVLRELARHVGPTRADCSETFAVAEARLQGSALD